MNRKAAILISQGLSLISKGIAELAEGIENVPMVVTGEAAVEENTAKKLAKKVEAMISEEPVAEKAEPVVEKPKAQKAKAEAPKAEAPAEVKPEDLRNEAKKALLDIAKADPENGRAKILEILQEVGATQLKEVKDEDLAFIVRTAKAAL